MGRGKSLSDEENGLIRGLLESGASFGQIASQVGRSDKVVRNYLKNPMTRRRAKGDHVH